MCYLTEEKAEEKIIAIIPESIKAPVVEVIKRSSGNRLEYEATFAVIFKHSKENSKLMTKAVVNLSKTEPKLFFSGSEVDEKFDIENCAIFISAECHSI